MLYKELEKTNKQVVKLDKQKGELQTKNVRLAKKIANEKHMVRSLKNMVV